MDLFGIKERRKNKILFENNNQETLKNMSVIRSVIDKLNSKLTNSDLHKYIIDYLDQIIEHTDSLVIEENTIKYNRDGDIFKVHFEPDFYSFNKIITEKSMYEGYFYEKKVILFDDIYVYVTEIDDNSYRSDKWLKCSKKYKEDRKIYLNNQLIYNFITELDSEFDNICTITERELFVNHSKEMVGRIRKTSSDETFGNVEYIASNFYDVADFNTRENNKYLRMYGWGSCSKEDFDNFFSENINQVNYQFKK